METKVKNREWVKNAAIIFLAVLLVLTFFSNTIMNRSLPEVATRNIGGGSITARIRVTGTVAANQSYQVMIDQSRRIKTVMVKQGQTVNAGDVLFILSDAESEELEAARETLSSLQRSYQESVISNSGGDRAVQSLRDQLAEAEAARDELAFDEALLTQAKENAEAAKAAADTAEAALDRVSAQLWELGALDYGTTLTRSDYLKLKGRAESLRSDYVKARSELDSATLIHGTYYNWIRARAEQMIKNTKEYKALSESRQQTYLDEKREAYMKYVLNLIENGMLFPYDAQLSDDGTYLETNPTEIAKYTLAYETITKAQEVYDEAKAAYESQSGQLPQILSGAEPALQAYEEAAEKQKNADKTYEEYTTRKADYDAAVKAVKTLQNEVDDAVFNLSKSNQLNALQYQEMREKIEKQEKLIEELTEDSGEKEIKAEVGGTIESISITAGQTTTPNSALAAIELPDMGYTMTATVSSEQARRLHTGDTATVANYYWGSRVDATLSNIKSDPKDPQNSKILTFDVSGDVSPGSNLTLSVGERSAEYDYIVPNSALRSDSNGDFILVVVAKSSPLGDRYTATRVDVTKLANDDTNTAVTGTLEYGDFVITTSTAPIKNGDRVRLADSQN